MQASPCRSPATSKTRWKMDAFTKSVVYARRQRRRSGRKRSNTIYAQSEDAARRYPSARATMMSLRAHLISRAMVLHGADALNVWRPSDVEHTLRHYTSHVGMRSTKRVEAGRK